MSDIGNFLSKIFFLEYTYGSGHAEHNGIMQPKFPARKSILISEEKELSTQEIESATLCINDFTMSDPEHVKCEIMMYPKYSISYFSFEQKEIESVAQEKQPTSIEILSCEPDKTSIDTTDLKPLKIYSLVEHEAEATYQIE